MRLTLTNAEHSILPRLLFVFLFKNKDQEQNGKRMGDLVQDILWQFINVQNYQQMD